MHVTDARVVRERRAVEQLMGLGVERNARLGNHRHDADAARGLAAGVLKVRELLDHRGLAGAHARLVQRVNVVEDANRDSQPIAFRTAHI